MKKFRLIDENVTQQIYDYLKTSDKFDNLTIDVEEHIVGQIFVSVKINDTSVIDRCLPSRDGLVGIPDQFNRQILYLSWQSKFFEDVEKLLDAPLFVKAYKNSENDYAIGETVIDGVKYECSLVSANDQEEPEFYIGVKFTESKGSLQINSGITTGWRNYSDLSKVFSEISEQL